MCWLIFIFYWVVYWNIKIFVLEDNFDFSIILNDDRIEKYWFMYYVNIFNFVCVKIKVMLSLMLKKYWKNMFEMLFINDMICYLDVRVCKMILNGKKVENGEWVFLINISSCVFFVFCDLESFVKCD